MMSDDNDGQMTFGDQEGLKLPDICLISEEKPRKNLTQETCPDRARCVTGAHATTLSTAVDDFFEVFPSPVRQMSGSVRHPRSPNIIWPSLSSIIIHLVRMTGYVNGECRRSPKCSCCLVGGPGIELIPHPGRPSMSLCGQKVCV